MKTLIISSIISLFSVSAFAENPYKSIRLGMSKKEAKQQCIPKTIETKEKMTIQMLSCTNKKTQEYMTFYLLNNKVGRVLVADSKKFEKFLENFLNKSWGIVEENKEDGENGNVLYLSPKEQNFLSIQVVNSFVLIIYSTVEYEKYVSSMEK